MADLIDRDVLIEFGETGEITDILPEYPSMAAHDRELACRVCRGWRKIVYSAPTVDAVPVVRCGDCKYCHDADGLLICRHGTVASRLVSENFFCAFGEK